MVDIVVIPESRSLSVKNKDSLKKIQVCPGNEIIMSWERDIMSLERGNYIFYMVLLIMVLICYNLEL